MTHSNSRTTVFLPLPMLLMVLVAVMAVGTATASPQFGTPVIYQTLPTGVRTRAIPRQCNPACTRIYLPVCGTDGSTYANLCILQFYECAYRNVSLAYPRQCVPGGAGGGVFPAQCPTLCHAFYEPVCGNNGKTYANLCILRAVACKNPALGLTLRSNGECATPTERPCPAVCPAIYKPVCGTDGQTYANQCVLDSTACNDPTLATASQGECSSATNPGQFPVDTPTRRIPSFITTPPPFFNFSPPRGSCPNNCDRLFNPVCGSDGRTYYNSCVLNLMACRERRNIGISYVGRCDGAGGVVAKRTVAAAGEGESGDNFIRQ